MFGLSGEHLILIIGVLFIFGPKKLPELGSFLGRTARAFREGIASKQIEPTYRRISEDADHSTSESIKRG